MYTNSELQKLLPVVTFPEISDFIRGKQQILILNNKFWIKQKEDVLSYNQRTYIIEFVK